MSIKGEVHVRLERFINHPYKIEPCAVVTPFRISYLRSLFNDAVKNSIASEDSMVKV
jgi:hypothetical protein